MTETAGIPLSALDATLTKVPVHLNRKPARAFDLPARFGQKICDYIAKVHETSVYEALTHLPARAFARLTVDEAAKAMHSAGYISSDVRDAINEDPTQRVLYKVRSSVWRWSCRTAGWNEMVDAYNGLRRFDLNVPGCSVTLDHTTSVNEIGKAQHSRVFLDGVFAYLVHFAGEHVMTIGFSIISGRRILLQQVQLKNQRGNRWLFRFPANRLEHIIDRLRAAFPGYGVLVADGGDVARHNIASYRRGLTQAEDMVRRYTKRVAEGGDILGRTAEYLEEAKEEVAFFAAKIAHLEAELPRLAAFYRNSGRYQQGKPFHRNDVTHRRLELPLAT